MQNISDPGNPPDTARAALQLHGVLVRVYGSGVLLLGESGTGKTACALKLVSEGHQLVADDVVEISRAGNGLVGTAPRIIRHLVAVRGLGIVDIRKLFGDSAFAIASSVDLCVQICNGLDLDRNGIDDQWMLGCKLPTFLFNSRSRSLAVFVKTTVRPKAGSEYRTRPTAEQAFALSNGK